MKYLSVAGLFFIASGTPDTPFAAGGSSAGSLDKTFDGDGKVTTDFSFQNDEVYDLAIQSDGKIVAVGYATTAPNYADFGVVRYNTNGSLDTTFGSGGKVVISGLGGAYGVASQTDGKIVAAGFSRVVRFLPNGSLDATFGSGGVVTSTISNIGDLTVQSDGKIVVAGGTYVPNDPYPAYYRADLSRYNADGTLDTSFGVSGSATGIFFGKANGLALQTDGKLVVAGTDDHDYIVARVNINGTLDSTFGTGGVRAIDFHNCVNDFYYGDYAEDIKIQGDGKVVVVGSSGICDSNGIGSFQHSMARMTSNGALDSTFGSGGKVLTNVNANSEYAYAVAIQADGKILVSGDYTVRAGKSSYVPVFALVRYNTNGTLDTSFASGGIAGTQIGNGGTARALAIQSNGRIVIGGGAAPASLYDFALARYLQ